jgi:hypothetical protein
VPPARRWRMKRHWDMPDSVGSQARRSEAGRGKRWTLWSRSSTAVDPNRVMILARPPGTPLPPKLESAPCPHRAVLLQSCESTTGRVDGPHILQITRHAAASVLESPHACTVPSSFRAAKAPRSSRWPAHPSDHQARRCLPLLELPHACTVPSSFRAAKA